ncbi:transglycosylase domain-containing protein [Brevibacillus humidisoli]|uniref:penicillin-binding protein 1A n=1 Tax=Brevibacillus humidisoli TaxID=2895522 RepID=UPI001E3F1BC5|nr:penicillin-binding protein 1A [Brevibacillus humidisoli]UFJ41558.1 transglycosylase domain-containing protein [Brevibacillus humidisoli]
MEKNQSAAGKPTQRKRRRGMKKHPAILALQVLLLLGAMGALLAGGVLTGYVASLVKDEPVRSREEYEEKIFSNHLTGFAYYSDGSMIGQLRAEQDRRLAKLSEVSQHLIKAIIATEDRHFYDHPGIVLQSTLRGAYQDFTNQPVVTGGSTLTQQLIKITVLSREVSHERKVKEIFNALRLERMFSKDQILEAYLNEMYFGKSANGSNIYGVKAAAKGIFDKDVGDLALAEASYMAGMLQSPAAYIPFEEDGYRRGKERQKMVLDRMLENQFITQEEYEKAIETDLRPLLAKPSARAYTEHPHLMMELEERAAQALLDAELQKNGRDKESIGPNEYRQLLEDKRREILRNGYHIYTTIDKRINDIMESIASNPENFGKNATYTVRLSNGEKKEIKDALEEVGAMMIDNDTGAILGMMGGRDFRVEQTNHATVPRQPGSSMKPLAAYAPAFELGLLQPATPIDDSPLLLADGSKGSHLPANWDNKYRGMISAREALRMSWNVPAIKTYLKVTIPTALDYVKKMGITTLVESDYHAATGVIGGLAYGLTVEEITNAYATFANQGSFVDAYMIERIEDTQGNVVFEHESNPVAVYSEQTAYLMTDMMRTVVNSGTGTAVRRHIPRSVDVAGKTGTTNDSNDLWFVGYTPAVSLGVWIGYDVPHQLPGSASSRPMDIWGKVIKEVLALEPAILDKNDRFEKPEGIVSYTVDSKSGLLPSELSKEAGHLITDLFNRQFIPNKQDDLHQKARIVEYEGKRYLAKEGTPDDFVTEGIFFRSPEPLNVSEENIKKHNRRVATRPLDWEQRLPEEEDPRTEQNGPPDMPLDLSVSQADGKVTLSWKTTGEPDLLGYRVYRTGRDGLYTHIGTVKDPKVTTYTDETGGSGQYAYYVTSVDISGQESPASMIATTGADGWVPVGPLPGSDIPGMPLPGGNTPDGNGSDTSGLPDSDLDGIDLPDTPEPDANAKPPSPPTNVSTKSTSDGVTISWETSESGEYIIAYNIYYSSDRDGTFRLLDTTVSTSYLNTYRDRSGWYYITAVNSHGESAPSRKVSGSE